MCARRCLFLVNSVDCPSLSLPLTYSFSLPICLSLGVSVSLSLCLTFPSPFLPSLHSSLPPFLPPPSAVLSLAGVVHSGLLQALCWVYICVFGNKHPHPASHHSSPVLFPGRGKILDVGGWIPRMVPVAFLGSGEGCFSGLGTSHVSLPDSWVTHRGKTAAEISGQQLDPSVWTI